MTDPTGSGHTTRRDFLALSGAAAGLASVGMAGWAQNTTEIDADAIANTDHAIDVLVIGGGMAGLFAAVKAHDAGAATMIVSKGRLGSSGLTPFGKGFFVFDPETETSTIDDFVETVSRSALGTNNATYTRQLAEHSLDRAKELRDWGYFDQALANRPFMKPIEERNIPLLERVVVTHLIKEDGRIAGAAGFRLDAEETVTIRARSVILCTGAGGFKPNGFPLGDLTHDGTVMAYRIGAKVTGKEWNDGHSTRIDNPAATYDGWGDMFERVPSTNGVEVRHDLGVDMNYQAYVLGNPVAGGPGAPQETVEVTGGPYVPDEFQRSFDGPLAAMARRLAAVRAARRAACLRALRPVPMSVVPLPEWRSTSPKGLCRLTKTAPRTSPAFMRRAMRLAATWPAGFIPRSARCWRDPPCRAPSRAKRRRAMPPGSQRRPSPTLA